MSAVEWKKLGDVCEIKTGKGITTKDCCDNGQYPIISGGITPMGMYHLFNRAANTITISRVGANAGYVNFVEQDFYLNDKCFSVIPFDNKKSSIDVKYLFFKLKSLEEDIVALQSEGGVPTINTTKVGNILIPIPSLAKQQEIVCHLDTFTSLISNLESELDMRRKQYEHYRNQLLDLEGKEGVEIKKISDICSIIKGGYITKKETIPGNIPVILGGQEPAYYINVSNHEGKAIVISRSGASAGFVSFWDEPIFVTDGFLIEPKNEKLKIEYLYCSLKDRQQIIQSLKRGAGVPHITTNHINDLQIPIPSLTKQTEIVEKLDAFENLIQSLEQEIKLRKQQYEYYREKLLTFEKE